MQWGLFAMSNTAQGRAWAARHFDQWRNWTRDPANVSPQTLARHVENALYWRPGPFAKPPMDRPDHAATLTLPAGVRRREPWFMAVSAMKAENEADATCRDNPFALERQKLFSVWHDSAGLIIDGSHSKYQPDNSTFVTIKNLQKPDYLPQGGTVSVGDDVHVQAAYRTFFGRVDLKPIDDTTMRLDFSIDPAGCSGPITASFTMPLRGEAVTADSGDTHSLTEDAFEITGPFRHGDVHISGPKDLRLQWPLKPFYSYAADHIPKRAMWILRVSFELTREAPKASVLVRIAPKA
jgi:hypothetical protein